jgi:hypothetical protein
LFFSELEVVFCVFLAENNFVNELSCLSGLGRRRSEGADEGVLRRCNKRLKPAEKMGAICRGSPHYNQPTAMLSGFGKVLLWRSSEN